MILNNLQPKPFREFLAKDPGRVFYANAACQCPLAEYILDAFLRESPYSKVMTVVISNMITVYDYTSTQPIAKTPNPEWGRKFYSEIDERYALASDEICPVTAAQALAVLDEVLKEAV